jgi:hypothetical protein
MKTYIYGYYGHENAGDEAFKLVFNNFLDGELIYVGTGNIPKFSGGKCRLIIGGGNLVGRYFIERLLDLGWDQCKDIYLCGIGLSDDFGLSLLKNLNPKEIWVRNLSELDKFKEAGFSAKFIPDIVLSVNSFREKQLSPLFDNYIFHEKSDKPSIAFVLSLEYLPAFDGTSSEMSFSNFEKGLVALGSLIEKLRLDYNIFLVSLSSDPYHYDETYSRLLYRLMPNAYKNVGIVNFHGDPELAIDFLANMKCVYSMKYHGLVFSLISNTPVVNISNNIKNNDLMSLYGLDEFNVPLIDAEPALLAKKLESLFSRVMNQIPDIDAKNNKHLQVITTYFDFLKSSSTK